MKTNNANKQLAAIDRQSKAFFSGGTFRWKKDEKQVWAALETAMKQKPAGRLIVINFKKSIMAFAALMLLLIGTGAFLRFYSVSVNIPAGQHQLAELPDGSTVHLNAESTLKYHPYWWTFSRKLHFEGEALFEVVKGRKFEVVSDKGRTAVLGTSFNILARGNDYTVTCLSGSVKVSSPSKNQIVLNPESKATIMPNGQIKVQQNIEILPEILWKDNLFRFTASPITEVFREIERQYGITIKANLTVNSRYTGSFNRLHSVDDVLSIVCPAMGLNYQKQANGVYLITQTNE